MTGHPLVRVVADWDASYLPRQLPSGSGAWGGVRFTIDPVRECDFLVMLNNRCLDAVTVCCPAEHVWTVMQEPYIPGLYDWMVEGHERFARVYTHHPLAGTKYIRSHPALPWLVNRTFDDLVDAGPPAKSHDVSWIAGRQNFLPGHRRRTALHQYLERSGAVSVDRFGRGVRPLDDKWDGLAPYRYSLAIENSNSPDYWTEKVADCFLAWTVPLYDGCTNLEDYFPLDSFIRIDASNPATAVEQIARVLREDRWERHLSALSEARRRVLFDYQMFAMLSREVRLCEESAAPVFVTIPSYRQRVWRHRARYLAANLRAGNLENLSQAFQSKLYWWWSRG